MRVLWSSEFGNYCRESYRFLSFYMIAKVLPRGQGDDSLGNVLMCKHEDLGLDP